MLMYRDLEQESGFEPLMFFTLILIILIFVGVIVFWIIVQKLSEPKNFMDRYEKKINKEEGYWEP